MQKSLLSKLENPNRPLLGPNVKALEFWGLLLPKSYFKISMYMILHLLVIIFTGTEIVDIYFVRSDMNLVLNNMKITMLATVSVCKVTTFILWQKKWKSIIEYVTKADMQQRKVADSKSWNIINSYTAYSRRITYMYWFLVYSTLVIVVFHPILKFILTPNYKENVRNGTDTFLEVASSWVPFDKNRVPGYLVACIYQTYASIYGVGWFTSFDTNAFVIMVFFRGELEMLRKDSAAIFGRQDAISSEESFQRLKSCRERHTELLKYARLFNTCLSPILLLYIFVCSIMLCATAQQIQIQSNAMEKFLTTEYLVFGVAQLFMYCWHSNDVMYTSQYLMRGPYESRWWLIEGKMSKDIYLLIDQFRKIITFNAGPFNNLTLPTFINILKGAYSYYTLLSKSQAK